MSQNTEKSLGQVLYEAFSAGSFSLRKRGWASLPPHAQADFESEAQAVAAVVREQCAQACDRLAAGNARYPDFQGGYESGAEDCAMAIRMMKP